MKINFQFVSASERTLKKIWAIHKPGGCGSNLGRAMFLLRKRISPSVRKESKRALFIISNGRLILGTSHKRAARLLKTENRFDVFVIGVGKNPNKEELSSLVSQPVKGHLILLKVFSDVFSSVRKALASGKGKQTQTHIPCIRIVLFCLYESSTGCKAHWDICEMRYIRTPIIIIIKIFPK
jgi:hypothetical protein